MQQDPNEQKVRAIAAKNNMKSLIIDTFIKDIETHGPIFQAIKKCLDPVQKIIEEQNKG